MKEIAVPCILHIRDTGVMPMGYEDVCMTLWGCVKLCGLIREGRRDLVLG